MNEPVRRWNITVKVIVVLIVLILMALVFYRFREVLPPLVIAFLVAFILDPIVDFLTERLHLSRGLATTLVFMILIVGTLGIIAAPVTVLPSVVELIDSGRDEIINFITDIGNRLSTPIQIWEYSLDLSEFYQDLSAMLRSFVSTVAQGTLDLAVTIASGAFWVVFIIMTAFYMVKDADRLIEQFDNLAPPGYREDFVRLRQRVTDVWNAFLRGQLLLSLAMAVLTIIICYAIGVPYAWIMGLLAGLMEFIPSVGPIIAAVPAVLVALILGSNVLPLGNFWFAVVVVGAYILIQQIEGNVLIPRIMGRTLNLHPLLVFIGIIVGGSLAGILGMLLAAPVVATLRVLGRYIFCRLYDRDPFAETEAREVKKRQKKTKLVKRTQQEVTSWRQRLKERRAHARERAHERAREQQQITAVENTAVENTAAESVVEVQVEKPEVDGLELAAQEKPQVQIEPETQVKPKRPRKTRKQQQETREQDAGGVAGELAETLTASPSPSGEASLGEASPSEGG